MAGYTTPAWTNDATPAIDASALTALGQAVETAEHPYGVCSTAAGTAAKTVTIDVSGTLELFAGLTVRVKFSNANTASAPTLNVNGTGAKALAAVGTASVENAWAAGDVVNCTYDGTNWVITSCLAAVAQTEAELAGGMAILSNGNTHAEIISGQYVYVRNHSTLADGLYKATADIDANGTLSINNVEAVSNGGFNELPGFARFYDFYIPRGKTYTLELSNYQCSAFMFGAISNSATPLQIVFSNGYAKIQNSTNYTATFITDGTYRKFTIKNTSSEYGRLGIVTNANITAELTEVT